LRRFGCPEGLGSARASQSRSQAFWATLAGMPGADCSPCDDVSWRLHPNFLGPAEAVSQLRIQRTNLVNNLKRVDGALSALGSLNGSNNHAQPRRTMSASGRRRIAAAQRARWAKVKAQNVVSIAKGKKPGKRTMAASARRKIAAAQRARWAKVKRAA
jgi:hypothetical protein